MLCKITLFPAARWMALAFLALMPAKLSRAQEGAACASAGSSCQTTTAAVAMMPSHMSGMFSGVKVNMGHAIHSARDGHQMLALSDDFVVPDSPAPHWQVVDSMGNTYLLNRLDIKGDRVNRTITIPTHVPDVAKVQIWCAWAEVVLGEAAFSQPVGGAAMMAHDSGMFHGAKANRGHVTHSTTGGQQMLTLSDDFVMPDAQAPHWQVVDSAGNTHLLNRLAIKGDRANRMITLPGYIRDVAKVQIWCAWAETLLGEAEFAMPVR
jgi:hypothetical protein